MNANDRVKVYKDLFDWAESTKEQVIYLQSRMYAVRVGIDMVVLVKAKNYDEAMRRVWEG